MASRPQVDELLRRGLSHEDVGRELGISAGLAFMIATGRPADGSGALPPSDRPLDAAAGGSAQRLVNPPEGPPAATGPLLEWVRERAVRELERAE